MMWFRRGNRREVLRDDRGVTAVEYGLIIAGVAILAIPAVFFLRDSSSTTFSETFDNEPGVNVCAAGDPNCTSFDALDAPAIPGLPIVVTLDATSVTSSSATLNGTANAQGTSTNVSFCWGTAEDLASCSLVSATPATLATSTATPVSTNISGLTDGVRYWYRVIGSSSKGTTYGATLSFLAGGASITVPTATTQAASGITSTGAQLNGYVNPGGTTASVTFCWGTQNKLNGCTSQSAGTVSSSQAVSVTLSGLTTGATYYFRVSATNSQGTDTGTIYSFTASGTAVTPPTVTTNAATLVNSTSATLNSTVSANGTDKADPWFCWGTSASLAPDCSNGTKVSGGSAVNSNQSNQSRSASLSGLAPATTYYFFAYAENQGNGVPGYGGTLSFTTDAAAPSVTTVAASPVGTTTATVNGTVSSNGAATTVTFKRCTDSGMTSNCATATAAESPVAASGTGVSVSYAWTGLSVGTQYYFQVIGNNGTGGPQTGNVLSFTTAAAAPSVTTVAASPVGTTTATVNGTVTSNGAATTVTFKGCTDSGMTANCATQTAAQSPVAASASGFAVSYAWTGLTASTTYYFQVIGNNGTGGSQVGSVLSFTTAAAVSPPTVTTGSATVLDKNTVILNGTVTANGASTTVTFKYCKNLAMTTSCTTVTATQSPVASSGVGVAVSKQDNVTKDTTYYFQVIGNNGTGGPQSGSVVSFTTPAS